jgi:hypothetical protein
MTAIGVQLQKDTLNEENARFAQAPLRQPVFLNSVPKCGSHLLRNIVRMFVPVDQQYDVQFVQHQMLQRHLAAFADPRMFRQDRRRGRSRAPPVAGSRPL